MPKLRQFYGGSGSLRGLVTILILMVGPTPYGLAMVITLSALVRELEGQPRHADGQLGVEHGAQPPGHALCPPDLDG